MESEQQFRHETALLELRKKCEAFRATQPNTREEEQQARALTDWIVFRQSRTFYLPKEDRSPFARDIEAAADVVAAKLISDAIEEERKSGGNFDYLVRMIEEGVVDLKRRPYLSFMRSEARKEIMNKIRGASGDKGKLREIRVIARNYSELGLLGKDKDADLFERLGD